MLIVTLWVFAIVLVLHILVTEKQVRRSQSRQDKLDEDLIRLIELNIAAFNHVCNELSKLRKEHKQMSTDLDTAIQGLTDKVTETEAGVADLQGSAAKEIADLQNVLALLAANPNDLETISKVNLIRDRIETLRANLASEKAALDADDASVPATPAKPAPSGSSTEPSA
jgi:chromosome segregation ATPase